MDAESTYPESSRFRRDVAAMMTERSHAIARSWLDIVKRVLAEDERSAFPGDDVLDHIPELVSAIADDLSAPVEDPSVSSLVTTRAAELGELRHEQRVSVHQILREYEELTRLLEALVMETTLGVDYPVSPGVVLSATHRLGLLLRGLMRTTVDTFVDRFATTIERQHEQLESFNRMVSHELRDSLHTIELAAELLTTGTPDAPEQARAIIRRALGRATSALESLEPLAREQANERVNPTRQDVDLRTFVRGLADDLAEQAAIAGVQIRVHDLPTARVDTANLDHVVTNLLSNAIKYADPEKRDRWVEVSPSHGPDGRIALCVRDNGVGIAPDDLAKVFERSYRCPSTASQDVQGSGMGLYIAKRCAEAMGGELTIESTPGDGTTVCCTIPRDDGSAPETASTDADQRAL